MTIIKMLISVTPPNDATAMKLVKYAVSIACWFLSSFAVVTGSFKCVVISFESVVVTG